MPQPFLQTPGCDGGNGVLRQEQIESHPARRIRHHAFQKKWIDEVFEIAQPGVAIHLPFFELMQADAEFFPNGFRAVNLRAENMDLVAAPTHFSDEINRLRRAAAGWRVKRLMRQKRDAQRRPGFMHPMTLFNLGRRVQIKSFRSAKTFDNRRGQFRLSASWDGVVAQLVERLNGIQEVRGSNPLGSTIPSQFLSEERLDVKARFQ